MQFSPEARSDIAAEHVEVQVVHALPRLRSAPHRAPARRGPLPFHLLGASESPLRQGFCLRQKRLYGAPPQARSAGLRRSGLSPEATSCLAAQYVEVQVEHALPRLHSPPDLWSGGGPG